MKRLVAMFVIGLMMVLAYANPMAPAPIHRLWFDYFDCYIQLDDGGLSVNDVYNIAFSTGGQTYYLPSSMEITQLPCVINLSEAIPDLELSPWSGELQCDVWGALQNFSWGDGDQVDLQTLEWGQSAVYVRNYLGMDFDAWAKDEDQNLDPWYPQLTVPLIINCRYDNGSPAPGFGVYFSNVYNNWGCTDMYGTFSHNIYAARNHIIIKEGFYYDSVWDEVYYPEPGDEIIINLVLPSNANHNDTQVTALSSFEIYPTVLRQSLQSNLRLETDMLDPATCHLELYNLRGSLIESTAYPQSGSYLLPPLSRGIYFLKLSENGRSLAQKRFVVLD